MTAFRAITRLKPRAWLGLCAALLAWRGPAGAVPANPRPMAAEQPDGTKISVSLKGDEYRHWQEDAGGYTVLKDTAGAWVYAEKAASGALRPGALRVGSADPAKLGVQKHLADDGRVRAASARRSQADSARRAREQSSPFRVSSAQSAVSGVGASPSRAPTPIVSGTMKNLVIMARFSDQTPAYSATLFNDLFNAVGYNYDGAMGSVKDYFNEVSYGQLSVDSVVSVWVTLPSSAAYYGANDVYGNDQHPQQMVIDAINALAATGFDFSQCDGNHDGWVDGLTIIHSGRGEEVGTNNPDYIWAHQWKLVTPIVKNGVSMQVYHTEPEQRGWDGYPSTFGLERIGTICHETGHFLGLPDLYDTKATPTSSGLGKFCLMSGGSWNGPNLADGSGDGVSPSHLSAWPKKYLGWITPTQLTTVGSKLLHRIEDDATALYELRDSAFPASEYFLVENRQGYKFDSYIPGVNRGLLIWHVDESMPGNTDPAHYLVDLEEAGGIQHLTLGTGVTGDDSDYYRGGNNTFTDTSVPNSKSYSNLPLKLPLTSVSATGVTMGFYLGTTDPTPPVTVANVYDGLTSGVDLARTGSVSQLSGNWTASADPETGLVGYYYAIGTAPGTANIAAWTSNGLGQSVTRTGLALTNGTTYYFGVKAVNGVGVYSAEKWSDGQYVDLNSPADVPYVNDGTGADLDYVPSVSQLSANWGASPSAGITGYSCAVGTTPGGTGIYDWATVGLATSVTKTGSFAEGTTYYFSVRALNSFGFYSSPVSSDGQMVDVTSPTAKLLVTSAQPARPGAFTAKLIVTEANPLAGAPQLQLRTSGGVLVPLTVSYLIASTWTVSANLESYYSSGTATFSFSAADKAGNRGTSLTDPSFAFETAISGASGGSIANSDGMAVAVPAGAYLAGNIFIKISTVPGSRVDAADAASPGSAKLQSVDLAREFRAYNSAGAPVTAFSAPLTITLSYPDANNDGRIDGDLVRESLAWIYYLDETLGQWTPVGTVTKNPSANTLSTQVSHFSVYSVRAAPGADADLAGLKAYPNPFDRRSASQLIIAGIPADAAGARVYIYNEAAELVRTLSPGDGLDPLNVATWDGRLKNGSRAATGLYLYLVKTSNYGKGKGKFFLVW